MNPKTYIVRAFCPVFANHSTIQILWLCFALAWGAAHLFDARSLYSTIAGSAPAEDSWSFGQFLPVVLLTLPILSMAENCYGKSNLARAYGVELMNPSRNFKPFLESYDTSPLIGTGGILDRNLLNYLDRILEK